MIGKRTLRALLSENLVALESDKKEPVFFESEKVNVIFWYKISDGIKNNVKKLKKVLAKPGRKRYTKQALERAGQNPPGGQASKES